MKTTTWVLADSYGWIDLDGDDVEIISCSDNVYGESEYTFEYMGSTHTSFAIFGGPRPGYLDVPRPG